MNISDVNFRVFLAVSGNKLLYSTGIYGIIPVLMKRKEQGCEYNFIGIQLR